MVLKEELVVEQKKVKWNKKTLTIIASNSARTYFAYFIRPRTEMDVVVMRFYHIAQCRPTQHTAQKYHPCVINFDASSSTF